MNLKDLLGALVATQGQKAGAGRGGARGGIVENLAKSLGGKAGAALVTALASMILGARRGRAVGEVLGRFGGAAIIGSLAWQVYQQWQARQAPGTAGGKQVPGRRPVRLLEAGEAPTEPVAPPPGSPLAPATPAEEQELSRILIRAMISAAKADGRVDAQEGAAIGAELAKLPLGEEDRAFVQEELHAPADVGRVAAGARSPELAAAVYAASLLAITVDTEAERDYLAALAARLGLAPDLVAMLHAGVEEAAPAVTPQGAG